MNSDSQFYVNFKLFIYLNFKQKLTKWVSEYTYSIVCLKASWANLICHSHQYNCVGSDCQTTTY